MSGWPKQDGSWALAPAADTDLDEVMTWFPDADAVDIWSGPRFRYPFTRKTFRADCRVGLMASYVLRRGDGMMAAFGQSYERDGRGHLARLVSNPSMRAQGAGKQLIRMIMAALEETHDYDEYSLFVYRHNLPAYRCYQSLGFRVVQYPDDAPMADRCFFLTKKATRRERSPSD